MLKHPKNPAIRSGSNRTFKEDPLINGYFDQLSIEALSSAGWYAEPTF